MIDYLASFTNTDGNAFPDTEAVNVSAPAAGDGTEFVAIMVNDIWGRAQAIMNYSGLTPDGVTEADGTAQILEALNKGWAIGPGIGVTYWKNDTPAAKGDRVLLLQGQVILIATYALLVAEVYVGDADNATAPAFYKTSDAGGTIRSTSGTYLVLPDTRGYALRGLDLAAAVDPDGASRSLGGSQLDAMQRMTGDFSKTGAAGINNDAATVNGVFSQGTSHAQGLQAVAVTAYEIDFDSDDSTSPNAAKTDDVETRMSNIATNHGITY